MIYSRSKTNASWTETEESILRRNYGYIPSSELAKRLQRSPDAISMRLKEINLPRTTKWPEYLTPNDIHNQLGINWRRVKTFIDLFFEPQILYERNRRTIAIPKNDIYKFFKDKNNHYRIEIGKIKNPEFIQIIKELRPKPEDMLLTTKQFCQYTSIPKNVVDDLLYVNKNYLHYELTISNTRQFELRTGLKIINLYKISKK